MDNRSMIENLKKVGISFEPGMSGEELDRAETVFRFRFPKELREFLSCGVPVGSSFFNYRDMSKKNVERLCEFQGSVERKFRFDLENNREDLLEMLGHRLGFAEDSEAFDNAVMHYLNQSVKLIPFYAHRCFFDGMDDMPIVSFWQPTDTIFYGGSFENYLGVEFLQEKRVLENIQERMNKAGIWQDIIW